MDQFNPTKQSHAFLRISVLLNSSAPKMFWNIFESMIFEVGTAAFFSVCFRFSLFFLHRKGGSFAFGISEEHGGRMAGRRTCGFIFSFYPP